MAFRETVERSFGRFADHIVTARWFVITAATFVTAILSLGLASLEIETSFESYLPESNERQQQFERFREQFGSSERVVVLLEPRDVFAQDFLQELRQLHDRLEDELPHVDRITSLVNARHLTGRDDVLRAEGLLDDWPETPADFERARETALANPLYRNTILSRDATATTIVIDLEGAEETAGGWPNDEAVPGELDPGFLSFDESPPVTRGGATKGKLLSTKQTDEFVRVLDSVLEASSPSGTSVHVAGTPMLAHRLGAMLTRDITIFFGVSFVLSGFFLWLLFRAAWATVLPLLIVGISVIGTLGFMGLAGIPLTAVTEILPSLLVAIGVGDAVHIQAMFCKRREEGDPTRDAIRWAMGHSGLAVLLTSLTTGASIAAFRSAELQPVIDLGVVAPIGVGFAFVYSVTLLPALLSFVPAVTVATSSRDSRGAAAPFDLDAVLTALGRIGTNHPRVVLAICGLAIMVAALGASTLRFSQDDLKWLPEGDTIRVAVERLNIVMEGAEPFELMIELDGEGDFREPALLAALDQLQREADALSIGEISVGQSISLVDVLKETHQALTEGDEDRRVLPDSRALISQELLLFESAAPEDLEDLSDTANRVIRLMMTVPFVDALHYPRFSRAVEHIAKEIFDDATPGTSARVTATGMMAISGETFELLFVSMARSYAIAFGAIAALMFVLIRHVRLGFLSIIPNLMPILLVLGIMGFAGTPIDVSSMLVGGILIGVVVDDTIHFVHNFTRYREHGGCSLDAVRRTLTTTGRAMLVTSIVLSIGFFSFTQAWLQNVSVFGLYCGLGVIFAFFADIVVMPALVAVALPCDPDCRCCHRVQSDP